MLVVAVVFACILPARTCVHIWRQHNGGSYGPRTLALADRDPPSDHLIDLAVRRFALGTNRRLSGTAQSCPYASESFNEENAHPGGRHGPSGSLAAIHTRMTTAMERHGTPARFVG